MSKAMTEAEKLVGRRLPALPKHIDTLMASFVKEDGTFCGKLSPADSWLKAAHKKARLNGWIRHCGLNIGFGTGRGQSSGLYYLTPAGEVEAISAKERVQATNQARAAWAQDHLASYRAARTQQSD